MVYISVNSGNWYSRIVSSGVSYGRGGDIQSRFFKVVRSCCVGPSGFGV